jgi:hypothetical protein
MKAPRPHRTAATLGIAAAGLTLGHWLAYALAAPGAHEREELLHAAGHGYLAFATQLAVLAGTLGLAGLFLARVRQQEGEGSFARDVVRLAAVQAGAFVAMEVGERLLSGASLHDLSHGPLLVIGLAVQLLVAIAGAALLRLTDRGAAAAHGLRSNVAPLPASPPTIVVPVAACSPPPRPSLGRFRSRAPPFTP